MSREAQARESIRRLLRYALDGATCNDLEEVDNEEPPKAVEVIQELKARRADRLQHSKQGKLPSMVAEYLRVQVPLTADFECVCKICLSPDVMASGAARTSIAVHVRVRQGKAICVQRSTSISIPTECYTLWS